MAYPTSVNSQITDAVTQTDVKTTGETPAQEMGKVYEQTEQDAANTENGQEQSDTNSEK